MRTRSILIAGLFLLLATIASAQPVVNPTKVTFDPSPDDAVLTSYEIGYFLTDTSLSPFFSSDLGKLTCAPGCEAPLPAKPAFGPFWARVRAVAVDVNSNPIASEWSEVSNPFDLLPVAPSGVVISK